MRARVAWAALVLLGCTAAPELPRGRPATPPPEAEMRARIATFAPAVVLGHRGAGTSRPGLPWPENSLSSVAHALGEGADGVEVDVEMAADGGLLLMHDDTLDRTTTCSGCVSAWSLASVQARCRLLDGDGRPTGEAPPSLSDLLRVWPEGAPLNVELKAYGSGCRTPKTGPSELARAAVAEVRSHGRGDDVLFSSFDLEAAAVAKWEAPEIYSAYVFDSNEVVQTDAAVAVGLDAIHPRFDVPAAAVARARAQGLQVNVWTVNDPDDVAAALASGVTGIITDDPALARRIVDGVRAPE